MATGKGEYASVQQLRRWEVPKGNVRLGQNLGSGHFGLVVKGFLKTGQGTQVVAVKMLKGGCAGHFLCSFNVSTFLDVSIGKDQIPPPPPHQF